MSDSLKRILLIIAFLAISFLIGLGIYWLFFKTKTATPGGGGQIPSVNGELPTSGERKASAPATPGNTNELPSAGTTAIPVPQISAGYYQPSNVTQISSEAVAYPSINSNGGVRYYNNNDGHFYKITDDGSTKPLTDEIFYNVNKVTWAKNNDKAVLEYPDNSKIIYNFETKKQTTLPKYWEEFSFSPDSRQVAAKSMGLSPENRWLVTINDDGSGTTPIENMGDNSDLVKVSWSPSRQTIAFSQTGEPLGAERRQVLFVGLNHENFKAATVEGAGFQPQWSPTGQKLLYSVYSSRNNYKPELWITDAYGDSIGGNRQMLKLDTWAEKCTFSDDTVLFCAVPRSLPEGAGILPEVANDIYDDMYKIDLKSGLKTNISLNGDYHINNISIDKNKNKIYFTDANQNGIFEIKI